MAKQIKNDKVKVQTTINQNDVDILNDVLLNFKMLVNNYAISLNEASNEYIYNIYLDIFLNLSKMQQQIFNLAFKKGWYVLESALNSKIDQKYKEFNKKTNELSIN